MASTYNKEWNNLSIEEKRDVIRVALKNGIRELPDIKAKYNEFAGGGSFYQKHRARWNNYLLRHGVPEQQAAKLSSFFSAQDALESGHGTSSAARQKNNFGGMQYLDKKSNKMVNISYPSVDAYMDAKWKMMQNRFGRALNANSIQEYSNLLNDPRYHGKGYMYALYEGYRDGKPLDVAKQTQHMNNYTRILMDIAGEKGFKGAPVPAGQAGEAPASIARPENPYTQYTPAEPFFNQNMTFVRPEDVRKAQEENALRMAESQNVAMQQERKQSVDSFNTLMSLLHTPNNSNSGILGTIATLASLNKNNRFDTGGVKQQPRQYIYDVLPSLFAKDGVKITVSSGFRPGAKTVEGKPSRHSLKQAADIVGDFKAIRRVLDDPNSYTSRWLLANGYGYLDETSATGTTKFWHDHKRDHSHYHIGMDSGIVSKYANMMKGRAQNPLPAQQDIVEQPIELAQATPDIPFTPSNPQAFFGVHPAQQQSVYDYVTTPTVEQPVYDPMAEEKNNALSNLSKFNAIMQLTSPSNSGNNNFLNTVGLLANMSAEGGKIHIKPENRGKFTALKKRTGHSATWFKEHGTPAQKKMATFALNARHWKHGYGGHIYDGTSEDSQQMNIPYAGELPDVTIMPRRIANKAWDKVQERWVGDMPTYYAVNPETGKEEMLREIGNGKYSTYDDKHVFDVLGAEAAKKQREQWIKNGGNASDFDKVMLGTLGLGLTPIALPEAATGIWAASLTPAGQTLLAGTLGGEAWEALNHGITGQSWGDNLGDVIGLDKDNYLGRTALGLANPFYGLSPNMVYKGGAAATELGKSLLNAGKNEVQYTARVADNAMDDVLAAASDYPFKYEIGTNDKLDQYLTRRRYSDKIHGKPTKSFLDFDPVTGDFAQSNERFAPDVVRGLPTHIQEDLMHNTVGRNMDAFINEGVTAEEAQAYVDRAKKAMEDVHVGRYSNSDYEKAGYDKTGGFYDDENNFISVNEGSGFPNGFVEKHEGRHLIDYQADDAVLMPETTGSDYDADKVASLMQRTKQKQNMVLGDAYDNDFLTIPESKFAEGLESYSHMSREAVTTNRDARDVLFAKHNFGEQDRLLQNKYIDKMSDADIFDAVSKANGYGRRYIERLKAEGKLTPKKAKQFREAMKYVGAVAAPISVGLTAAGITSKTSDKK